MSCAIITVTNHRSGPTGLDSRPFGHELLSNDARTGKGLVLPYWLAGKWSVVTGDGRCIPAIWVRLGFDLD